MLCASGYWYKCHFRAKLKRPRRSRRNWTICNEEEDPNGERRRLKGLKKEESFNIKEAINKGLVKLEIMVHHKGNLELPRSLLKGRSKES